MRKDLEEIWAAGLAAADPERAVRRALEIEDDAIVVDGARFAAKRTPSSRPSAPDAMSAVTCPSERPANATMSCASWSV